MRMNKKKIVPKLRFPEFGTSEGWKKYKLRELADRVTKKVGDNKLVTLSISAGIGFVSQAEKFSRDISGKQYRNYIYLKRGEFSYNKGNSKTFPQGCIYELKEYDEAAVPNAFISFRFKENLVSSFYQGYFDSNFHGKQLVRFITSGARSDGLLNISPTDFFSIVLPSPVKKEEQQKIADCLSSIDELIDAESRKLKALEKHKKGLMQKLFPAAGKTLPEWRFPGFRDRDAWIKIMLGDILDVLMCKRIFANETSEIGDVPFYKIGTLGGKADSFISRALFEKYKKNYRFPRKGEILISCSGTVGRCLPYDGEDAYYQDSNIVWIDNSMLLISNELLLQLLSNVHWNKLNSTTITRIYTSDLKKLILTFPQNKDEQHKIADCLSKVDTLITEQAKKVEQLKAHKIGLMQGLFPSLEEADV